MCGITVETSYKWHFLESKKSKTKMKLYINEALKIIFEMFFLRFIAIVCYLCNEQFISYTAHLRPMLLFSSAQKSSTHRLEEPQRSSGPKPSLCLQTMNCFGFIFIINSICHKCSECFLWVPNVDYRFLY